MPDQTQLPDQPDGIDEQTHDLPDPARSAERVGEYIRAFGDGLCDVQDGNPLYARDLEALTRVPAQHADVQEDLARTIDEADHLRRELDTTRTEADHAIALLRQVRDHVGEHGQGEMDVWSLRELLSRNPEQDHTNCTPGICAVVTAPVPGSSHARKSPEQIAHETYERWRLTPNRDAYIAAVIREAAHVAYRAGQENAAGGSQASEPAEPSVIVADALYRALVDAGILHTGQRVRRIVIDSRAGQPVVVHVDRFGDERLLDVVPALAGVEVREDLPAEPAAPKLAQGGRRNGCGPACSEGHTYEAGCAIEPPARAFLGERPCGKPGCPCGGTAERPVDLDDRAPRPGGHRG